MQLIKRVKQLLSFYMKQSPNICFNGGKQGAKYEYSHYHLCINIKKEVTKEYISMFACKWSEYFWERGFPKVTQLVGSGAGIQTQAVWLCLQSVPRDDCDQ